MQVQKRKCENNTAVCPALSLGWSENMQEARPLLLVNVSVPLWECRSAQTAPCSGSSAEDKSLRKGKKKIFFFFCSGRCPRYLLGLQTVWVAGATDPCWDWGWGQFSEDETG